MSDVVDSQTRSRMMSGIKGKNTKPELTIRSALHRIGFRFRLHRKDLPGRPDVILPRYRAVILINGCFWHGHMCSLFKWPKTREDFWREKILGNVKRDQRNQSMLIEKHWRVCVIWECELRSQPPEKIEKLMKQLAEWIEGEGELVEFPEPSQNSQK